MSYENVLEVPAGAGVKERIRGFYQEIGWTVLNGQTNHTITVRPEVLDSDTLSTIEYSQTRNMDRTKKFVTRRLPEPSEFALGLVISDNVHNIPEATIYAPTDDDVLEIFETGGYVLRQHTFSPPHQGHDGLLFRFTDPFRYGVRVEKGSGPIDMDSVSTFDFRQNWSSKAVHTVWKNFVSLTNKHPDFPMTLGDDDIMRGSLIETAKWLQANGYQFRSYTVIIKKLLDSKRTNTQTEDRSS